MEAAFKLKDEISVQTEHAREVLERLENLIYSVSPRKRASNVIHVSLVELHDKQSGRIDAQKVAEYMGIPLKRLVEGLDLSYKAAHKNPSSESFQVVLQPIKRILEILDEIFAKPETVRAWLNTPHADLGGRTALQTILEKNSQAVLTVLENAVAGVPV